MEDILHAMTFRKTKTGHIIGMQQVLVDIDKKRHKRNPFDQKYIDFVRSPFTEEGEEDGNVIEAACCNLESRLEIMRAMRGVLKKENQFSKESCIQREVKKMRKRKDGDQRQGGVDEDIDDIISRFELFEKERIYEKFSANDFSFVFEKLRQFETGSKPVDTSVCLVDPTAEFARHDMKSFEEFGIVIYRILDCPSLGRQLIESYMDKKEISEIKDTAIQLDPVDTKLFVDDDGPRLLPLDLWRQQELERKYLAKWRELEDIFREVQTPRPQSPTVEDNMEISRPAAAEYPNDSNENTCLYTDYLELSSGEDDLNAAVDVLVSDKDTKSGKKKKPRATRRSQKPSGILKRLLKIARQSNKQQKTSNSKRSRSRVSSAGRRESSSACRTQTLPSVPLLQTRQPGATSSHILESIQVPSSKTFCYGSINSTSRRNEMRSMTPTLSNAKSTILSQFRKPSRRIGNSSFGGPRLISASELLVNAETENSEDILREESSATDLIRATAICDEDSLDDLMSIYASSSSGCSIAEVEDKSNICNQEWVQDITTIDTIASRDISYQLPTQPSEIEAELNNVEMDERTPTIDETESIGVLGILDEIDLIVKEPDDDQPTPGTKGGSQSASGLKRPEAYFADYIKVRLFSETSAERIQGALSKRQKLVKSCEMAPLLSRIKAIVEQSFSEGRLELALQEIKQTVAQSDPFTDASIKVRPPLNPKLPHETHQRIFLALLLLIREINDDSFSFSLSLKRRQSKEIVLKICHRSV